MKMRTMLITVGLLLGVAWGSVHAETAAASVTVSEAYARAVPPGQPNSASFMLLKNASNMDHALVGAQSDAAETVELHTHSMKDGMMQMRRVARIEIPAGGETRLQPGGLHVMLIGLKGDLQPGEDVALRLQFEDGSTLEVAAPVRKLQMRMMKHDADMKHQGMQHEGMKH